MRNALSDVSFKLLRGANRMLSRALGMRIMRHENLYPWQLSYPEERARAARLDPDPALSPDNPRLMELVARYEAFESPASASRVWTGLKLSPRELRAFRGHSPYVNQLSGLAYGDLNYALTYYALKSGRAADLLAAMEEDGGFGVHAIEVDGRLVSRDLLDSAGEIEFLRTRLDLGTLRGVLDIGAGYGRLAHRFGQLDGQMPPVFSTDAFPLSTFLSAFFLARQNSPNRRVVALDEVETFLESTPIDLAINVHSFSECEPAAVDWWLTLLARHLVRHLFVIANRIDPQSGACQFNDGAPMEPIFQRHGYHLQVQAPRFADPFLGEHGIDPCQMQLFARD